MHFGSALLILLIVFRNTGRMATVCMTVCLAHVTFVSRPAFIVTCGTSSQGGVVEFVTTLPQ